MTRRAALPSINESRPDELPAIIRAEGEHLHAHGALVDPKKFAEWCANLVENAERRRADEALSLDRAAEESGFSSSHLRHLVSSGAIPNAGKKGRPLIARRDLPKKPSTTTQQRNCDVEADARRLALG